MSNWKPEDEVTTTFGSIKKAQMDAYNDGWEDAIKYVIDISKQMQYTNPYIKPTPRRTGAKNSMTKYWDINVWFVDFGQDAFGINQWDDVITLNPAIYVLDGESVTKVYTGIRYECTPEETAKIREYRNEMEYGTDWWDFRDELYALEISKGINDFLNDLPDPYSIDIEHQDSLSHIDSISKLHDLVG